MSLSDPCGAASDLPGHGEQVVCRNPGVEEVFEAAGGVHVFDSEDHALGLGSRETQRDDQALEITNAKASRISNLDGGESLLIPAQGDICRKQGESPSLDLTVQGGHVDSLTK